MDKHLWSLSVSCGKGSRPQNASQRLNDSGGQQKTNVYRMPNRVSIPRLSFGTFSFLYFARERVNGGLALTLLVLRIFADNHHATLALDDLALFTDGLYRRTDFHDVTSSGSVNSCCAT